MTIEWSWLGRVAYLDALERQRARREAVIGGRAPEILFLLEHEAVVTTGRRPVDDLERVKAAGIPVIATERGGLATWHGPGQLVGYPIVDVGRRRVGVRAWVELIEGVVIGWLRERGVAAERRPGFPGAWVAGSKICAVGTHFRRGVSMHGFALNLTPELSAFGLFTPCGIADAGVTSAEREGLAITPAEAAPSLARSFVDAVDRSAGRQ